LIFNLLAKVRQLAGAGGGGATPRRALLTETEDVYIREVEAENQRDIAELDEQDGPAQMVMRAIAPALPQPALPQPPAKVRPHRCLGRASVILVLQESRLICAAVLFGPSWGFTACSD
jgi:hypothetical protein